MSDFELDLRSLKLKSDGAAGLLIYDFLFVDNSNTYLTPLRAIYV